MNRFWGAAVVAVGIMWAGAAQADCNQPAAQAVTQVPVDGHPFSAIPAADGCTVFVSFLGKLSRIAVLKRDNGTLSVSQTVSIEGKVAGMALSPDGRFLAAANGAGALLFDTATLARGDAHPLHDLRVDAEAGSINVAFSPDGHLLFIANEKAATISVFDVSGLPAAPKAIGKLSTGNAPVGMTFSADGKLLYATSEIGSSSWAPKCTSEGKPHPSGMLLVFDISKAATDSSIAMAAGVAAGCNAVRVMLSPDGGTAYVTARGDNAVHVLDTARLMTDPTHALKTSITVGSSPVGLAVAGANVFITNSDRFGGGVNQTVSVLDATHPEAPARTIPAGGFPRELKLTADGNTLLVTNFATQTLELVDLKRLDQATQPAK